MYRKWLTILLLIFMPLQFSWAALSTYCQHESDTTTTHIGHHDHQHKKSKHALENSKTPAELLKNQSSESDCSICLAAYTPFFSRQLPVSLLALSASPITDYRAHIPAPPAQRLERPQWFALA